MSYIPEESLPLQGLGQVNVEVVQIHHARQMVLRLVRATARFSNWRRALELLPIPACG